MKSESHKLYPTLYSLKVQRSRKTVRYILTTIIINLIKKENVCNFRIIVLR